MPVRLWLAPWDVVRKRRASADHLIFAKASSRLVGYGARNSIPHLPETQFLRDPPFFPLVFLLFSRFLCRESPARGPASSLHQLFSSFLSSLDRFLSSFSKASPRRPFCCLLALAYTNQPGQRSSTPSRSSAKPALSPLPLSSILLYSLYSSLVCVCLCIVFFPSFLFLLFLAREVLAKDRGSPLAIVLTLVPRRAKRFLSFSLSLSLSASLLLVLRRHAPQRASLLDAA